jgi:hypothetical protein
MADLTPERLARLRVWATRQNPDRIHQGKHGYYAFCPWCSDVGDPDQPDDDGNAHDLAIELLDEIERLRGIVAAIAEADPRASVGYDGEMWVCTLCSPDGSAHSDGDWGQDPVDHDPECPWRMAKESTDA